MTVRSKRLRELTMTTAQRQEIIATPAGAQRAALLRRGPCPVCLRYLCPREHSECSPRRPVVPEC